MSDTTIDFFPASLADAVGPHFARAMRYSLATATSASSAIAAAAVAGKSVTLSASEADHAIVSVALRATALRWSGRLPVFRVDDAAKTVSPSNGTGAIGIDPCGPIWGRSDPQSVLALLACGRAIRVGGGVVLGGADPTPTPPPGPSTTADQKSAYQAGYVRGQSDAASGVPALPPAGTVPPSLQASYAAGYLAGYASVTSPVVTGGGGEKLGVAPAIVVGGIAAAVLLVGGAGYLIGSYSEQAKGEAVKWDAEKVLAIRRAEIAADLALQRWRLEAETGTKFDPSPLEIGAADDVKTLAAQEKSSRWFGFGLAALAGAAVAGAVVYGAPAVGLKV